MAKNVREMSDSQLMELRRKMIENINMVDRERQRRKDKTKEMKKSSFFSSLLGSDDEERPAAGGRKKKKKKKMKIKKERREDEGKTRKIKATNEDMKYVLKKDGVSYSKRLKKADLERLVRRHNLVGKAEKRCKRRKVKL